MYLARSPSSGVSVELLDPFAGEDSQRFLDRVRQLEVVTVGKRLGLQWWAGEDFHCSLEQVSLSDMGQPP